MTVSRASLMRVSGLVMGVAAVLTSSVYVARQHDAATDRGRELADAQARFVAADKRSVDLAAQLGRAQGDTAAAEGRTADLQRRFDATQRAWVGQAEATTARYEADLKSIRTSLAEARRIHDLNGFQLESLKLQLTAADAVIDGLRSTVIPDLEKKCDKLDKQIDALTPELDQYQAGNVKLNARVVELSGYQEAWTAVSEQLNRAPVRWGPNRDEPATGGNVGKRAMDAVLIKYMPAMDKDSRSRVIRARFEGDCDNDFGRGLSTPKQPGD